MNIVVANRNSEQWFSLLVLC